MNDILTDNPKFLWYQSLLEAKNLTKVDTSDELDSYIILLLLSSDHNVLLSKDPLGVLYLKSQQAFNNNTSLLRNVADSCLILSGFYPENAIARNVSPDYFANIGVASYFQLSEVCFQNGRGASLYCSLACSYYELVKILFCIRLLSDKENLNHKECLYCACNGLYDEVYQIVKNY